MQADVNRFMIIVFSKFAFMVSLRTLLNQTDSFIITGSLVLKTKPGIPAGAAG